MILFAVRYDFKEIDMQIYVEHYLTDCVDMFHQTLKIFV